MLADVFGLLWFTTSIVPRKKQVQTNEAGAALSGA